MKVLREFSRSLIGAKLIVAATGVCLIVFVLGHLAGNLQIFVGRAQLNWYAHHLKALGPLLWVIRFGLGATLALHVYFALRLAFANRAARGSQRYRVEVALRTGAASRTMVATGLCLLGFLVYHILHFTVGTTHPHIMTQRDATGGADVYAMVVLGFRDPWIAGFYLAAMALLCAHVSHAASSVFQTFGFGTKRAWPGLALGAQALAWTLFLGNAAIVLACWCGALKLPWEGVS